jgi:glycosyltransferase involved in cell wall biosynthesis
MKPFFTIIIPTLNEEKFVGKLLGDLSKQHRNDFEVIVIDANSDDKTLVEVRRFKSCFSSFRTISFKERNVAKQRNTAARVAKGNYLVFLDADSRVTPSFLKKLGAYIKKYKGLLFLPSFTVSRQDPQLNLAIDIGNILVGLSAKIGKPFSTGGSMILEKNFFFLIGGFPEDVLLSEDHLLVHNAYKFGVSAKILPNIKIQFSLRRFYREGKLELLLKYFKSTIYFLARGKVDKKIIEYEMGGHLYNKKSKKVFLDLLKINPRHLLKNFNKNIRTFIRGLDI